MGYSAILFDLDGTLVDSTQLWVQAYQETFADHDLSITEDEVVSSLQQRRTMEDNLALKGADHDAEELKEKRDTRYCTLLHESAMWMNNHVPLVLVQLKTQGYPLGLVTNSRRSYVEPLDRKLALNSVFSTIITTDEMGARSKPDPYGLLLACEELKVDPSETLYVGDQLFDMLAARDAGIHGVLIPSSSTPNEARQYADTVLESIEEIETIFNRG